jgi:hypothetical protein
MKDLLLAQPPPKQVVRPPPSNSRKRRYHLFMNLFLLLTTLITDTENANHASPWLQRKNKRRPTCHSPFQSDRLARALRPVRLQLRSITNQRPTRLQMAGRKHHPPPRRPNRIRNQSQPPPPKPVDRWELARVFTQRPALGGPVALAVVVVSAVVGAPLFAALAKGGGLNSSPSRLNLLSPPLCPHPSPFSVSTVLNLSVSTAR